MIRVMMGCDEAWTLDSRSFKYLEIRSYIARDHLNLLTKAFHCYNELVRRH
jgi:hypothetical protein